ncbi:hypothetical protein [Actinokineospora enzanensis]|uniref:hypothetical protein n=1 Tax=Actinokineospora enzanensis TaxID=155975 RepID=UPI0003A072EA|nr:hypothetical protein [Actinokineospora enzanensis]
MAAAWNELPAAVSAASECAALLDAAEHLRHTAPELTERFAARALARTTTVPVRSANPRPTPSDSPGPAVGTDSTTDPESPTGDRATQPTIPAARTAGSIDAAIGTRARVLLSTSLVRLGRHAEAVEPGLVALHAVTGGGRVEWAATLRVALAACARVLGEPLAGCEFLRPVLRLREAAPAIRAAALAQFVACAVHVGNRDDLEDALAEADRLFAADEAAGPDGRRVQRALLSARTASYHRRHGDTEAATEAAREGLSLLNRLADPHAEGGLARPRLVLELVCALLDEGDLDEAARVAATALDEPVRATSALALGRLRLAVATRVHLPSGRSAPGRALLVDVVRVAERHGLDSLLADAWTFLAHAEEEAARPGDALHALRSARAAEYRHLRAAEAARALLIAEVGAVRDPESAVSLLRDTVRPATPPAPAVPRQTRPATATFAAVLVRVTPQGLAEPVEPAEPPLPVGGEVSLNALAIHVRDLAPQDAELLRSDRGEFAVLLPATDRPTAEALATAIRDTATEAQWLIDDNGHELTLATGVAVTPTTPDGNPRDGVEPLLLAARKAMRVPEVISPAPAVLRRTDRFHRAPTTAKTVPVGQDTIPSHAATPGAETRAPRESAPAGTRAATEPSPPAANPVPETPTPEPVAPEQATAGQHSPSPSTDPVAPPATGAGPSPAHSAPVASTTPADATGDSPAASPDVPAVSHAAPTSSGPAGTSDPATDDSPVAASGVPGLFPALSAGLVDPSDADGGPAPTPDVPSSPSGGSRTSSTGAAGSAGSVAASGVSPYSAPGSPASAAVTGDAGSATAGVPPSHTAPGAVARSAPPGSAGVASDHAVPPGESALPHPPADPPVATGPGAPHAAQAESLAPGVPAARDSTERRADAATGSDALSASSRFGHAAETLPSQESATPRHGGGAGSIPARHLSGGLRRRRAADEEPAAEPIPVSPRAGAIESVLNADEVDEPTPGRRAARRAQDPETSTVDTEAAAQSVLSRFGVTAEGGGRRRAPDDDGYPVDDPVPEPDPYDLGSVSLPAPPMFPASMAPPNTPWDDTEPTIPIPGARRADSGVLHTSGSLDAPRLGAPADEPEPTPPLGSPLPEPATAFAPGLPAADPGPAPTPKPVLDNPDPAPGTHGLTGRTPTAPSSFLSAPTAHGPTDPEPAPATGTHGISAAKSSYGAQGPVPGLHGSVAPVPGPPRGEAGPVPGTQGLPTDDSGFVPVAPGSAPGDPGQSGTHRPVAGMPGDPGPMAAAGPTLDDPARATASRPAGSGPAPRTPGADLEPLFAAGFTRVDPPATASTPIVPPEPRAPEAIPRTPEGDVPPQVSDADRRAIDFAARLRGLPRSAAFAQREPEPEPDPEQASATDPDDDRPALPTRKRRTPGSRRERTDPSGLADLLAEALVAFQATQATQATQAEQAEQPTPTAPADPGLDVPRWSDGWADLPLFGAEPDRLPEPSRPVGTQVDNSGELRRPEPARWPPPADARPPAAAAEPDRRRSWATDARAAEPAERAEPRRTDLSGLPTPPSGIRGRHRSSEWAPADLDSG